MAKHVLENDVVRWIYGWDRSLQTFMLLKWDKTLPDDQNPIFHIGKRIRELPEAEDLFTVAKMTGFKIPQEMHDDLHSEKLETQASFVVHYEREFVDGLTCGSLAQAELFTDDLKRARSDKKLLIRRVLIED